jgi:uncharacterized protein
MRMAKLGRLMPPGLLQMIEPLRLAIIGEVLAGQYVLRDMQRLCKLLHDNCGEVSYRLEFRRHEKERFFCITGVIRANLHAVCQRCLDGMEVYINNEVYLGIVRDRSEAAGLPAGYEPLLVGDEPVSLRELLEDELLLAMPMSPMHDPEHCPATGILAGLKERAETSPFAKLKELAQKVRY